MPPAAFVALMLAIGEAGVLAYGCLTDQIRRERQNDLLAITGLKARPVLT